MAIGSDTINRIYQTDVNYVKRYNLTEFNSNINIKDYIDNIFKSNGNCKFLLYDRLDYKRLEETNLYNEYIECVDYKDDGISSSKIRSGES